MVRAIVVGAGDISKVWFAALKAEGVEVVAVVDLDLARADTAIAFCQLDHAEPFTDYREAIAERKADFLLDLTTPAAHRDVTCAAIDAGLPVLGEKPMSNNLDDARAMVEAAQQAGLLYAVSQSRRWEPGAIVMRDAVRAGRIGRITAVYCDFLIGVHYTGFRAEMDSPLLNDMAIHHFDLARTMAGIDPIGVYCRQYNPANSWAKNGCAADCLFDMTDGVAFTYRGSWCAEGKRTAWNGNWRIVGTQGSLVWADDQPPMLHEVEPSDKFIWDCWNEELDTPDMPRSGMHENLREFLAELNGGPAPQCVATDNLKSYAMAACAIESDRTRSQTNISTIV